MLKATGRRSICSGITIPKASEPQLDLSNGSHGRVPRVCQQFERLALSCVGNSNRCNEAVDQAYRRSEFLIEWEPQELP